jgi:hypothetical protein
MAVAREVWAMVVVALLLVGGGGCDRARDAWGSLRGESNPGETGTAELEAEAELSAEQAALERERLLAEQARLEAERREREAAAAEQRRQQLEQADALVATWAERLANAKDESGAFLAHQGLTEDDPWATPLRVRYTPDPAEAAHADSQTLEVRSAGPNRSFDDDDDLVRTRTTTIARPFFERNKWWLLLGFVWIGAGFLSAGGLRRRRHRKRGDEHPDAADILLGILHVVFAPLALLFWLGVLVLEIFVELVD